MRSGQRPPLTAEEVPALASEQAALRRVATLVARGGPPDGLFARGVEEVARLLSVEFVHLGRYEPDRTVTFVAVSGTSGAVLPVGTRLGLGGENVGTLVFQTGSPARIDSYADASGPLAVAATDRSVRCSVGAPIAVEGSLWGVIIVGSSPTRPPLPAHTEARLASFTELVSTAVANAESRAELSRLAAQQAALRRVATLVARGAPPEEVFAAVVNEVWQLPPGDYAGMARYDPDAMVTSVAARGTTHFPVGSSQILGGKNTATLVFETGHSVRIDGYVDASGQIGDNARERGGVRSSV